MDNKRKDISDRIKQQLNELSERIPDIKWIGLIDDDGSRLGYYSKHHFHEIPTVTREIISPSGERILVEEEHEEADRVSAMSAATISLSARISDEIGTGEWEFTVVAGKQAKEIVLSINEKICLVAIVEHSTSIDAMLIALKSASEGLMELYRTSTLNN